MIGSNLEPDIGSLKFLTLYILSGFGGISFSALCTDTLSMGASTAVFGLSGVYVAFIILNYSFLASRPDKLCQIIMFLFISIFLSVMLGSKNIDVLGHLGGFITGAIIGHWILPCLEQAEDKKARARKLAYWSKIATVIWFVAVIGSFYLWRDPKNMSGNLTSVSSATTPALESKDEGSASDTLAQIVAPEVFDDLSG